MESAAGAEGGRPAPLRVGVAGGGPAGLGCAIGLARQGHEVDVFERLDAPLVRGLVSRERSYPTAVEARGMRALERLGAAGPDSAVRARMARREDFPFDALLGSRDALVQGLLEHIEGCQAAWPGVVRVHHRCAVVGVDLRHRSLEVAPESDAAGAEAAARGAPFDLICACDGRNSPVRESAMSQDPSLTVTRHEDNVFFKTINLDHPEGLVPGRYHCFGDVNAVVLPSGTGVGRVGMWTAWDGKGAEGRACGAGQLRRMGLHELLPYISAEEEAAFDSRRVSSSGGGVNASRLVVGGCLALVGDSATSYVETSFGQGGANHGLEMAASLSDALAARGGGSLEETLRAWSEARMPDELAFAQGRLGEPWDTAPYRELFAKGKGKSNGKPGKSIGKEKGGGKGKGKEKDKKGKDKEKGKGKNRGGGVGAGQAAADLSLGQRISRRICPSRAQWTKLSAPAAAPPPPARSPRGAAPPPASGAAGGAAPPAARGLPPALPASLGGFAPVQLVLYGDLFLKDRGIGDDDCVAIAPLLGQNRVLRQLHIGHNSLGDVGAAAICRALADGGSPIELLGLRRCQIGDGGAEALAELVRASRKLAHVDVDQNRIGDAGAEALAATLAECPSLRHLYIGGNRIGDAGRSKLADAAGPDLQVHFSR